MSIDYIRNLLELHYNEALDGLVDKAPSRLLRGEGTEKDFYILKIDLVGSTQILYKRHKSTYLKIAHTFLSSIDKITQDFGADPNQTEYAGDSVLAYFPESSTTAEQLLQAASYSRAAVLEIQRLDETLKSLQLKCKVVLHFDTLIMSKIGPRASSFITAIGLPLHKVAKLEKEISADIGRATEKFFQKVSAKNKKYLTPVYDEKQVEIPAHQPSFNSLISRGLLNAQPVIPHNTLLSRTLFGDLPPSQIVQTPQYRIDRTLIGYNLRWPLLFRDLNLTKY